MNKRLLILVSSLIVAIFSIWGLTQVSWNPLAAYLAYAVLAVIFLGILISNQQYEEDSYSKVERVVSAFLLSYIVFFRFLYAPLSQFFFGALITKPSFFADLLSLLFFALFFFLFGTAFLVINASSRAGFLSQWRLFNNEKMFFVWRGLFISAIGIFLLFYLRNSFFSMKNSAVINRVLPPVTCNWTYIRYPNFLSLGRTVAGREACLYNYSQDKDDLKICDSIEDGEIRDICAQYFVPDTGE